MRKKNKWFLISLDIRDRSITSGKAHLLENKILYEPSNDNEDRDDLIPGGLLSVY